MFDPQVGDRCAWRLYTDVEPCTVVKRTAKTVTVRMDEAVLARKPEMVPGGFGGVVTREAEWEIRENLAGRLMKFTLRKNGQWKGQGTAANGRGDVLTPGWRKVYDYGF